MVRGDEYRPPAPDAIQAWYHYRGRGSGAALYYDFIEALEIMRHFAWKSSPIEMDKASPRFS